MNTEQTSCCGLGRILGHKYQARYDVSNSVSDESAKEIRAMTAIVTDDVLDVFRAEQLTALASVTDQMGVSKQTYVHDVCVRCGDVKKRSV